jgi:hypothetical protein
MICPKTLTSGWTSLSTILLVDLKRFQFPSTTNFDKFFMIRDCRHVSLAS